MSTKIIKPEQLNFFFWLGEDGEITNVCEEEFMEKQEKWDGPRPDEGVGG